MELMDLIPKKAVMEKNLAPILKTICTWILASSKATEKIFLSGFLNSISRRENLFINKWQFGNIVAFMDPYIFKGNDFFIKEN